MGIELSDEQLSEICTHANAQIQASCIEYRRLLDALREKLPTVTYDVVATATKNLLEGTQHDDGQASSHAALCCALYQLAVDTTNGCIALLRNGQANGAVFQSLLSSTSGAFEALGALAFVLNGGPIAQSFIDQGIKQQAVARAVVAANTKHAATNEAKKWVQEQWRYGGHRAPFSGNKSDFARHYVEQVKEEFPGVEVTVKTIAEVWLSPTALN